LAEKVGEKLWHPTFICEHPLEISPLTRENDTEPNAAYGEAGIFSLHASA